MKITIELTDAQVKGIKNYLSDFDMEKITKQEIVFYIDGIVNGVLSSPHEAVSDYILKAEKE